MYTLAYTAYVPTDAHACMACINIGMHIQMHVHQVIFTRGCYEGAEVRPCPDAERGGPSGHQQYGPRRHQARPVLCRQRRLAGTRRLRPLLGHWSVSLLVATCLELEACAHTHTHTPHTHTHTHTPYTHTHAYIHKHAHTYIHTHTHMCV